MIYFKMNPLVIKKSFGNFGTSLEEAKAPTFKYSIIYINKTQQDILDYPRQPWGRPSKIFKHLGRYA